MGQLDLDYVEDPGVNDVQFQSAALRLGLRITAVSTLNFENAGLRQVDAVQLLFDHLLKNSQIDVPLHRSLLRGRDGSNRGW